MSTIALALLKPAEHVTQTNMLTYKHNISHNHTEAHQQLSSLHCRVGGIKDCHLATLCVIGAQSATCNGDTAKRKQQHSMTRRQKQTQPGNTKHSHRNKTRPLTPHPSQHQAPSPVRKRMTSSIAAMSARQRASTPCCVGLREGRSDVT